MTGDFLGTLLDSFGSFCGILFLHLTADCHPQLSELRDCEVDAWVHHTRELRTGVRVHHLPGGLLVEAEARAFRKCYFMGFIFLMNAFLPCFQEFLEGDAHWPSLSSPHDSIECPQPLTPFARSPRRCDLEKQQTNGRRSSLSLGISKRRCGRKPW